MQCLGCFAPVDYSLCTEDRCNQVWCEECAQKWQATQRGSCDVLPCPGCRQPMSYRGNNWEPYRNPVVFATHLWTSSMTFIGYEWMIYVWLSSAHTFAGFFVLCGAVFMITPHCFSELLEAYRSRSDAVVLMMVRWSVNSTALWFILPPCLLLKLVAPDSSATIFGWAILVANVFLLPFQALIQWRLARVMLGTAKFERRYKHASSNAISGDAQSSVIPVA